MGVACYVDEGFANGVSCLEGLCEIGKVASFGKYATSGRSDEIVNLAKVNVLLLTKMLRPSQLHCRGERGALPLSGKSM